MFCKQYCIVYIEDAQKRQKRYAHAYKLKHKIQYTVCKTVLIAQTAKELGQTQDCASNSCFFKGKVFTPRNDYVSSID